MTTWRETAVCTSVDPEIFFPDKLNDKRVIEAKRVCTGCIAKAECLQEALITDVMGIWGGTDEYERAVMKGRRIKRRTQIMRYDSYYSSIKHLGLSG
jgi:WhiB family transcriptional regulator, redox-sensing transcriptional regulator